MFAGVHLVALAEQLERITAAVARGKSCSTVARRPFTFLGQWWLHGKPEAKLVGQWLIRKVA